MDDKPPALHPLRISPGMHEGLPNQRQQQGALREEQLMQAAVINPRNGLVQPCQQGCSKPLGM